VVVVAAVLDKYVYVCLQCLGEGLIEVHYVLGGHVFYFFAA